MATYDFVVVDRLRAAFGSREEGTKCRAITREIVSLASSQVPLISFLDLLEAVVSKDTLAVVDCVEVTWRGIETNEDLSRIFATLSEESLVEGLACLHHRRCTICSLNLY